MLVLNKDMRKKLFDALVFAVDNFEEIAIPMANEKGKWTSMNHCNELLKIQLKRLFNHDR